MKEQTREDPTILAAAERQMHAWVLQEELHDRAGLHGGESPSTGRTLHFVTISREAGVGGSEIAQNVGQRLGWKVFDKNLLDQIASRFHLPRPMLDVLNVEQLGKAVAVAEILTALVRQGATAGSASA
jgi:hypothetical protein